MNILLSNDDGIDSAGVRTLAKFLAPWANVWACVPKVQQSGTGHGITVRDSLRVREEEMAGAKKAWSVEGKPADCVKMALLTLVPETVDLVISGINEGANLGTDTLYSGTVAAAMEGAFNGIPAMAVSLAVGEKPWDFEPAAQIAATLYRRWEAGVLPIPPMSILNVNVPNLPLDQIKGYKAARLGIQHYSDSYDLLEEAEDYRKFCLLGERIPCREMDLTLDTAAIRHGYVALTPISVDRTDYALLKEIEKYFE